PDDHVLRAASQLDVAVLIDAGEVTGVQPSVDDLPQSVEDRTAVDIADDITREDRRSADRQVSHRIRWQVFPFSGFTVYLNGFHPLVGQSLANPSWAGVADEVSRCRTRRFGESVSLAQRHPRSVLDRDTRG